MEEFITYANGLGATDSVITWLNTTLSNYLIKNKPATSEVEHVIDYLVNNKIPKIAQMSYPQAVAKAEKWILAINKKGNLIKELPMRAF